MRKHSRITIARIDGVERDKDGFLRCDARLSKTGVFEYQDAAGNTIRELRPDDEVFAPESLGSYMGAAVTRRHPQTFVTPDNHRILSVGTVLSAEPDPPYVRGRIKITDTQTAKEIEEGKWVEISMGYHADIDDGDGETYDAVQRGIVINHAALLKTGEGRLGSDVRVLRLDSNNNAVEIPGGPFKDNDMVKQERLDQAAVTATDEHDDETVRADADDETTEETADAQAPLQAPKADEETEDAGDEPADEEKAEDADDKEPADEPAAEETEEEDADDEEPKFDAESAIKELHGKLDELLARTPKPESDADHDGEKTDTKDDVQAVVDARVAKALRVRAAHAKLCPGVRQDGKSDADLCREALAAVDVDADGQTEDTLVVMAETAAKAKPVQDATPAPTGPSFAERLLGQSITTEPKSFVDRLVKSVS